MSNSQLSPAILAAIDAWERADEVKRIAVENERNARDALIKLAYTAPHEGTNNLDMPDGHVLQGKFPNSYSLDKDNLKVQAVAKALPTALRDGLIKWKPEISVAAYKALEPKWRAVVNEILTIKPGSPQISIVRPKNG